MMKNLNKHDASETTTSEQSEPFNKRDDVLDGHAVPRQNNVVSLLSFSELPAVTALVRGVANICVPDECLKRRIGGSISRTQTHQIKQSALVRVQRDRLLPQQ